MVCAADYHTGCFVALIGAIVLFQNFTP